MTADRKTIDNIGERASNAYALGDKIRNDPLLQDAIRVQPPGTIDVSRPCIHSETDLLLQAEKTHQPIALFEWPTGFLEQNRRIFTSQVIPSLGSAEKLENLIQKLEKVPHESLEEAGKVSDCLKKVKEIDKSFIAINGFRGQYHRG